MINWIKSFFVTEEKETKPKCASCGLGATKYVLMEFKTLAFEDLEEKIMIKICDGCYDDIYLNRLVVVEEQRVTLYKQYVADGMRHFQAYQKSKRSLKI